MQLIMRLHLLSQTCLRWNLRFIAKLIEGSIRVLCSARLPTEARVHPSVLFSHNGLAVLITKEAKIASGCQIGTHVVIGSNWPKLGAPELESDVIVGPGAIVLGPITIGRGSVIAAGSIVLSDVPPGVLMAGNPASVKKQNIDSNFYRYPST
jgi:serine O-acetyltransferase